MDIKFIPEAEKDYKSLDGSIKKLVNERIDDLKDDAYIGEELWNIHNNQLTKINIYHINKHWDKIFYLNGEKHGTI